MRMLGFLLLLGALAFLTYVVYLLSCAIKRRWCLHSTDEEDAAAREPFVTKDISIGQTLKRPSSGRFAGVKPDAGALITPDYLNIPEENLSQNIDSSLTLEVISGPSAGVQLSQGSQQDSGHAIGLGRIPQNDIVLNDPEVSGKHALISWNHQLLKWELVDLGSLNGTLVNLKPISAETGGRARRRGEPVGLVNGDVITLGSTSQVQVRIIHGQSGRFCLSAVPFGVGVAMDVRKGKLPMEDVSHCEWPLHGVEKFGLFCIFDGHGGAAAAQAASKIMSAKLSEILKEKGKREKVVSECDASSVLRDAFRETEECLEHEYEGCTATVLLLWCDANDDNVIYAQCANVGDSACVFSVEGRQVVMTQDHKITSFVERQRLLEMGKRLRDGETRIYGMNIGRALGDKFLKEQEKCFSAEPYICKAVKVVCRESKAMGVMASDGLWDVMSPMRALQLAMEARYGRYSKGAAATATATAITTATATLNAEEIAQLLLNNARLLRTKDDTTVVVFDFSASLSSSSSSQQQQQQRHHHRHRHHPHSTL